MSSPQDWIEEVSKDSLTEVNRNVAQWVRLTGTEDERRSFDYLAATLQGMGLTTTLHEPTCLVSLPVSGALNVDGEDFTCITHSFSISTSPSGVAGELVYAGGGSAEELAAAGAAGKIVLTEGLASPQKAFAATQAGVRALVCISGDHIHEMTVSPVWGSPTPETFQLLPQVPIISVNTSDGDRLKGMIDDGPARARVATEVDTRWRKIPVLLADLDVDDREYVMFSGHVDSWHYGAMDNASANATMVEVARIMANHRDAMRRGLRLAFWSGHSQARYAGSTWFADAYWFDLRERCVAHVNVDSTGGIGADDLTTANTMAETYELAKEAIRRQTGQELIYQRFGRAGDQSFWGVGLPAVFMSLSHQGEPSEVTADLVRLTGGTSARGGGLGWWWHTTEDTLDKIDPDLLVRDTKVYVEVVGRLTCDPVIPLDVRGPIAEMLAELDDIEELWAGLPSSGPDDSPGFDALRVDLEAAQQEAARMQGVIESSLDDDRAAAISDAVVRASKRLMPANYTISGEFGHDLAMGAQTLPLLRPSAPVVGMSDDEQWAALHQLRRSVNNVRYHVQEATRVLRSAG